MKLFKKTVITRLGDTNDKPVPYLIRWSLVTTPWFTIKLHKILISDEACLHCHPWDFVSIILWGGYTEERWDITKLLGYRPGDTYYFDMAQAGSLAHGTVPTSKKWCWPGCILWRPSPWPHRLEVTRPAWTLVLTSGKTREWGFYTLKGWIPWFKYSPENSCE